MILGLIIVSEIVVANLAVALVALVF